MRIPKILLISIVLISGIFAYRFVFNWSSFWQSLFYSLIVAFGGIVANWFLFYISLIPGAKIVFEPRKIKSQLIPLTLRSISEEVVFRGALLSILKGFWGFWGVLVEVLLFTLIHLKRGLINLIFAFCIGLGFSLIVMRTSNIIGPIIGHLIFNIISYVALRYEHPKIPLIINR